jgi:choline dehydrogenase-like flavoprotein
MIERAVDILIVGSGAGGATVAKELAPLCRDGVRIAVLEWGPKLRDDEFTSQELEMAGKLYFDSGGFLNTSKTLALAFVKAYGGSTVAYTGTSIAIPQQVVERHWAVPGLDWHDLMRRTEKYKAENNVHELDDSLINENNRLFRDGCARYSDGAGSRPLAVKKFPVNVRDCQGSGMCNMGCPNQAKQGTNRVQLPAAERQGVEVVTNCRVETIGEKHVIATVRYAHCGLPSPWPNGRYRISAKTIVVSCGSVNSPALLQRSALPVRLPALGRYFTCHPALTLVAQHPRPLVNYYGFPKTYYCDDFETAQHFILETCMYFPFTTAKNLAGFGAQHSAFMSDFRRLQQILVLVSDPALPDNRIAIDRDGNPVLHYDFPDMVLDAFVESQKVSARIFFAAGAERVHAPAAAKFAIERSEAGELDRLIDRRYLRLGKISITSAHHMGGCRMGADPASSVTDIWGRVHGVPWLYVADASLFPGSSSVNPYLTIMSLADRVAEGIRARGRELLAA